ncbi:GNAT family N-acetyltransferase [Erwinia sp. 9145]|uniref:GNAT family N-acetyltransferase n=1 Tax=Erwinia sp. 9145 TaxID=1500895 RepID=UPI00055250A1|nr:GNAT family N-acetyltransferase [Erwinia sp. 9145]
MVTLAECLDEERNLYFTIFINEYTNDLIKNHRLPQPQAHQKAADLIAASFPGEKAAENYLLFSFHTQNDTGKCHVGYFWIQVSPGDHSAFIMDFFIFPEWRNKKLGGEALQALSEKLQALNILSVKLRVAPDNNAALHLYQKSGFAVTGINMAWEIGAGE